jgi:hypothetical protein
MSKRYVSQSWGSTGIVPVRRARASSFEAMVRSLGLSPTEYERSPELREWVRLNRERKYVPANLLVAWGFDHLNEF